MTSPDLYAVLMAGGSGTRFWPASRRARPKQFLPIGGEQPMLTTTAHRLGDLVPTERLLVSTGIPYRAEVQRLLPELPEQNILAEPLARNTLPCLVWAAREIERRAPGSLQVTLAADHVIEPAEEFRDSLRAAAQAAGDGSLVTLGIRPTRPATGYGYIEVGEQLSPHEARTDSAPVHPVHPVHIVRRFVEKPDANLAAEFLASGNFLWNSGMFIWRTDAFLAAVERWCPELAPLADIDGTSSPSKIESAFAALPSLSVDVGLMERADNVLVLPVDYTWNDVGSWSALPGVSAADESGNFTSGGAQLISEQSTGCVVHGEEGELVALLGVEDLVVVRAGRTTLVCPRERAEEVRAIVAALEARAPEHL
ncbi:MAG: sugar phosphate nucleotidyltransferase [Planctomycetota bacterium]|nr:mannose-1-phosphate guanylyltransferase [Planctomycetota bacterium]MDP6956374.1 sugar phosphate nucleotidyltransferase [Planctomycetota bacterium]